MRPRGLRLTDLEALVPLSVIEGRSRALDVRSGRLHVPGALITRLLADAKLDWLEAEELFDGPDGPQVILCADLPPEVRGTAVIAVTAAGALTIALAKLDLCPFGVGLSMAAKLIRGRFPPRPWIRRGKGLTIIEVDTVKLGSALGLSLPKASGVAIENGALVLSFGPLSPRTAAIAAPKPPRRVTTPRRER